MPKKKTEKTSVGKDLKEEKKVVTEKKTLSPKEFESNVLELAGKGMTSEKIGEALRKQGIHPKEHGKISKILKEKGVYEIADIKNTEKKLARVTAQMEKNAQDKRAMRERERIISLLRRQKAYHKIGQ